MTAQPLPSPFRSSRPQASYSPPAAECAAGARSDSLAPLIINGFSFFQPRRQRNGRARYTGDLANHRAQEPTTQHHSTETYDETAAALSSVTRKLSNVVSSGRSTWGPGFAKLDEQRMYAQCALEAASAEVRCDLIDLVLLTGMRTRGEEMRPIPVDSPRRCQRMLLSNPLAECVGGC